MTIDRGLLIHPDELSEAWIARLLASNLKRFGLHPKGGLNAHVSMGAFITEQNVLAERLGRLETAGLTVEHEMHAIRWMLPAEKFKEHPSWFRMDEHGDRVPDFNLCVSNKDALEYIRLRAAEAARLLPAKSHRYHFWTDDVRFAQCQCPECRALSASDQTMVITNTITEGLRRTDPIASQCYLAYFQTLTAPQQVEPTDGVFLEFAPMGRDYHLAMNDPSSEKNASLIAALPDLFACFGRRNSLALEYWLDNSMYSRQVKPPKYFEWNRDVTAADLAFYEEQGFEAAMTFACFLGEDYEELYGSFPNIEEYFMW